MQELQQPAGFAVFGTILRHRPQDSLGVIAENGKFYQIGGVEQHVGVLLVRIYPLDFRTPDVRPVRDCFPGGVSSFVIVPYNAPQETVVAGRDAIVLIQRDAGDGIDEYAEFDIVLDLVEKRRIEPGASLRRLPFISRMPVTKLYSGTSTSSPARSLMTSSCR